MAVGRLALPWVVVPEEGGFLREVKSCMNVTKAVAARQRPREFLGQRGQVMKLLQAVRRVLVLARKVSRAEGLEEAEEEGETRTRESDRVARQVQGAGEMGQPQSLGLTLSEMV